MGLMPIVYINMSTLLLFIHDCANEYSPEVPERGCMATQVLAIVQFECLTPCT